MGIRSFMARMVVAVAAMSRHGPDSTGVHASIRTHDRPRRTGPHRPTLMTVHAHPDDETIGTGGTMAKAVAAGRRVVLVTGTRGEMGEIVVPDMDTPDNHRRLGEIRAGELERAMGRLGVTEWENLGYRDSDMMGTAGNRDPRSFWQADLDEAAGRLVWLVRRYQPDVMTTYNEFGGYGHPDHIRTHDVGGPRVRAGRRPGLVPGAARRSRGTSTGAWAPSKLYEPGDPGVGPRARWRERMEELGKKIVLVAAGGRDARADRRVRGVRGEDARPRRADHDLGRRLRRAARGASGRRSTST